MEKQKFPEKLRICHVTSELTPIVKAGGLGDVVGYLPKEISEKFHVENRIIIPKYKNIDLKNYPAVEIMEDIKLKFANGKRYPVKIWKTFIPETIIPVYLVESDILFPGKGIYDHGHSLKNFSGSFIGFSRVVIELFRALDWHPDVVHCHDGMMGMVIKWLKALYSHDPYYKDISTVLTIHNLSYQPLIPIDKVYKLELKRSDFKKTRKYLLNKKKVNIMAEAIENADMVNTVSPTYAREVLTKKYSFGLHKLLQSNKKRFTGILNGIEYHDFDPRTNDDTPVKYWIENLDKKVENKLYLQKKLGLTVTPDLPLICVVSRLTEQKGLDLIEDVLKDLVDMGAQFVILGSGDEKIEKIFIKAEKENPRDVAAEMEFDAHFAQTIYAGADMLLMPSRFEPCGLSQIIAMRFGTIPIVRRTGGLADTVRDGYSGFVFHDYDKNAFLWVLRRAVDVFYNQKDHWRKMQVYAMRKDFSWRASAKKYIWLYKKAIANHKLYLENNKNDQT